VPGDELPPSRPRELVEDEVPEDMQSYLTKAADFFE
jgi:hypothetical protein